MLANPMGAILSSALMLETLGQRRRQARAIERAVEAAIGAEQTTADIGGTLGTREVGDWIIRTHSFVTRIDSHGRYRVHSRWRTHADDPVRRRAQGRLGDRPRRHRRPRRARAHRGRSRVGGPRRLRQRQQSSVDAHYGARHVGLKAGLPIEVPALTVNRLCGSGIQAIAERRAAPSSAKPTWSSPAAWRT